MSNMYLKSLEMYRFGIILVAHTNRPKIIGSGIMMRMVPILRCVPIFKIFIRTHNLKKNRFMGVVCISTDRYHMIL